MKATAWIVSFAAMALPGTTLAKAKWEEGEQIRRRFSLGLTFLKEQGFGIAVRGRINHFGGEISGGGNPWFLFAQGSCDELIFGFAPHVTASLLFFITDHERFFQSGIRAAAIWDRVYGFGGMLGYMGELSFTKLIALQAGVGLQIYPLGERRPKEIAEDECPGAVIDFNPITTIVQPYFGVNLLFYLL
jgi:hypothetical protein